MKRREARDTVIGYKRLNDSPRKLSTRIAERVASRLQHGLPMQSSWILALVGGAMIGLASSFLLLTHGRIAGISGILGSLLQATTRDRDWRLAFVGGMVAAGIVAGTIAPATIGPAVRTLPTVIIAGLLVGYGTSLGSGCTSGHGVCGLSRFSARSLVAVMTFMTTGAATAMIMRGGA